MLPLPPLPLEAPPAALTEPVLTPVLLLPVCPVADEVPLDALAVPELDTLVVFVVPVVALLLPPLVAPPVVVLPPELDETDVVVEAPVDETLPLEAVPELLLDELAPVLFWAVVPAAKVGVPTSIASTPAAAPARSGSSACFLMFLALVGRESVSEPGFLDRATLLAPTTFEFVIGGTRFA